MFKKEVLDLVKKIPQGRITTYKILAEALGRPSFSRQVGEALGKNTQRDGYKTFSSRDFSFSGRDEEDEQRCLRRNRITVKADLRSLTKS